MRKKFSWSVFAIKITSRKLWVSLAGMATSIMAFANCNSNTIVQVTAIIGALGSVAGYLIANGLTDDAAEAAGMAETDAGGKTEGANTNFAGTSGWKKAVSKAENI